MSILSDDQIAKEVVIDPPAEWPNKKPQTGKLSWGISSYGLDLRLGYKFRVFKPYPCTVIDPKKFDSRMLEEVDLFPGHQWDPTGSCDRCGVHRRAALECEPQPDHILIPPHSFVLAESLEYLEIPRNVLVVVVGKSTLARCSLIVNVTPLEPEWKGKVTIEISNTAPLPAKLYPGEGICQCLFLRADAVCKVSYADRKGKYDNQKGLTLPKVTKEGE